MTTFIKDIKKLDLCGQVYHLQYWFWNPHQISKSKKKNIQIGPETRKLDFCDPDSHLGKEQYQIWNTHQISKSKRIFFYSNRSIKKEIGKIRHLWSRESF